eukprot:CAMPEP_0196789658 /NCGR_PEP_ID=MMETSP1104-20130614/26922_1 /TAXON_ID=33652 /ORGANISM="Cafeteria sp., Strain Caron Lab Isolate" /LENGTH=460 /DNA_ID=CAMNT_0042160019 /DNA_START=67 /DNA_END=1446 /DNA_ORIENTATION=+
MADPVVPEGLDVASFSAAIKRPGPTMEECVVLRGSIGVVNEVISGEGVLPGQMIWTGEWFFTDGSDRVSDFMYVCDAAGSTWNVDTGDMEQEDVAQGQTKSEGGAASSSRGPASSAGSAGAAASRNKTSGASMAACGDQAASLQEKGAQSASSAAAAASSAAASALAGNRRGRALSTDSAASLADVPLLTPPGVRVLPRVSLHPPKVLALVPPMEGPGMDAVGAAGGAQGVGLLPPGSSGMASMPSTSAGGGSIGLDAGLAHTFPTPPPQPCIPFPVAHTCWHGEFRILRKKRGPRKSVEAFHLNFVADPSSGERCQPRTPPVNGNGTALVAPESSADGGVCSSAPHRYWDVVGEGDNDFGSFMIYGRLDLRLGYMACERHYIQAKRRKRKAHRAELARYAHRHSPVPSTGEEPAGGSVTVDGRRISRRKRVTNRFLMQDTGKEGGGDEQGAGAGAGAGA